MSCEHEHCISVPPKDKYFSYDPIDETIKFYNGKVACKVALDVDGYHKVYWDGAVGLWEGWHLAAIAAVLMDLNSEWDRELNEFFRSEGDKA